MVFRLFQVRRASRRRFEDAAARSRFLNFPKFVVLLGIAFLGNRLWVTTSRRFLRFRPIADFICLFCHAMNGLNSFRRTNLRLDAVAHMGLDPDADALLSSSVQGRGLQLDADVVAPSTSL